MARLAVVACALAALLAASSRGAAAQQGVGSIITRSVFDGMLPQRNNALCPARGFYTYDAFLAAARAFPAFGTTGDLATRKRELAAFFGETSHETTGGTRGAADQFQWGYCFKEERDKTDPPFYGRGPIQLTHRYNYEAAGKALGVDLVSNPNLVATDPVVSFKTAIWFWMTAQASKPSCHDVATGRWAPTAADRAAGRAPPGYGVITNIINGGVECGMGPNFSGADRVGYYKRYCDMLGVGYGSNLDCYNQKKFG
ncbi:chitinase 8-like [Phragmites australis]|uniref:chitinase 8-like n=1 Tax=Phragmites australis TaxID=29695 RepID=UPI002D777FA4|nr:chitinase 8-like [Phragmites australis]